MQMKRKNHANNIHDVLKSKSIQCHWKLMTTWKLYTRQEIVMCSRLIKTILINVVLPTFFIVFNNIVELGSGKSIAQHCSIMFSST